MKQPVICIADDRASCEPGIRILIASLAEHSPSLRIELFYPPADQSFTAWASKFPNVAVNPPGLDGPWAGFNIKPAALIGLLDRGFDNLLWIDTDIVVRSPIEKLYEHFDPTFLIISEEALCSSHY